MVFAVTHWSVILLLIRRIFFTLFVLANMEQSLANNISQQSAIDVVDIQYLLEDQVEYDFNRILSFDSSRWQNAASYPLNLGNIEQGAWIRFKLRNVEQAPSKRIVEFSNPGLHKLDVFSLSEGSLHFSWQLGSYLPFVERPILIRNFALPVELSANEERTYYARAESNVGVLIPVKVMEEGEFWRLANNENLAYGLYFGILLMFVAFNAGMYLARNDFIFLLLSVDLLVFAFMYANHLGLNFEYLWPVDPEFNYLAGLFFSYLVVLTANIFTWHFLRLPSSKTLLSVYYGFNVTSVLGIVLLWFVPISVSSLICALLGMAIALFLFGLTVLAWKAKYEFSFYYMLIYAFAALTTLIYVAHKLALLPTNFATNYAIGYSILLQSIVLTSVLIERRKVEKKILGFEGQAKVIPNSTRDWIAQFSHEIRTPLNGVIGMADLLKETPLNPTQYNYVRVLGSSGEHLIELVSDVLDFESLSSGEVELNVAPFNLKDVCDDVFTLFKQQANENKVDLELDFAPDMPVVYQGDGKRLKQILINLISNSIKFTHDGQIKMSAKYKKECLLITVFDTGIGMTKQQQLGIFERFRQADQAIYAKYGGSGLGLAICRQLVRLMAGEIQVKSKLGEYTRFTIELPLIEARVETVIEPEPEKEVIQHSQVNDSFRPMVGSELIILGVDDNEINRRVLNAMLKKLGHKMIAASSGQEALEVVRSGLNIDLILMDCEMPGMNGFEATESIRHWQYGQAQKPCPIVALTAHILEEHKEKCIEAGMDEHLSKPLHLDDLKEVIGKLEQGVLGH